MRRTAAGLEVKDLNSANGTLFGAKRIEPDTWTELEPVKSFRWPKPGCFGRKLLPLNPP
jgi:hypothetical protein